MTDKEMSDGSVFTGFLDTDGVIQLEGKSKFTDGSQYEGAYTDGMFHGYGTFKDSKGEIYKGNWERGVKSGQGEFTFDQGYYRGQFKDDFYNGQGKGYDK